MDDRVRQRLVGASVLTVLAVIFIPMVLDTAEYDGLPFLSEAPPRPIPEMPDRIELPPRAEPVPAAAVLKQADEPPATADTPIGEPLVAESWVIQVASFREAPKADHLREKLRKAGFPAFTQTAVTDEHEVFRVRVGPDLSRTRAERMLVQIEKQTGEKGNILRHGH